MRLGEGNDGKASLAQERRIGEQCTLFDVSQSYGMRNSLSGGNSDDGDFGIGGIDREHVGGADGATLVAGKVDDEFVAFFHLAQMLDGRRIGYSIPDGFVVLLELLEGIDGGFGLEQIVHGEELYHSLRGELRAMPE